MERLTMREAIVKYWPASLGAAPSVKELAKPGTPRALGERHYPAKEKMSDGEWTGLLFEMLAEDKLIQPTILYEFPTDISPLSKQKPDDPSMTVRFEIYVARMAVSNGISWLNDPSDYT